MDDIAATTYLDYAGSRLREAGERSAIAMHGGYEASLGELAKISSLTWDGAMDILSALATLGSVETTGRSSDLRRYAQGVLSKEEFSLWSYLARLHNFQHKPNHPEAIFRESCRGTAIFLSILNSRLPLSLQLSDDCRDWLAAV